MPDIQAISWWSTSLEVGRRAVGSPNPIAIFLVGCRERLPEWELQSARRSPASAPASDSAVCPRGQTPARHQTRLSQQSVPEKH